MGPSPVLFDEVTTTLEVRGFYYFCEGDSAPRVGVGGGWSFLGWGSGHCRMGEPPPGLGVQTPGPRSLQKSWGGYECLAPVKQWYVRGNSSRLDLGLSDVKSVRRPLRRRHPTPDLYLLEPVPYPQKIPFGRRLAPGRGPSLRKPPG